MSGVILKIALLNVKRDKKQFIYKDWAGGFGASFHIGDSIFAKFLEFAKRRSINLPLISFGYLAAIFRKNGHKVEYLENKIPDSDLVIIHSSIVDFKNEIAFAERIKKETDAKVGFIGPFSGLIPTLFKKYSDFIVMGEPEKISMKITDNWMPSGLVKSTRLEDLNSILFPDWGKFPIKKYSYRPVIKRKPVLPILSSRGCPYKCSYCPYIVFYKKWGFRTPVNVVDEIAYLIKNYGIKGLIFRDPIFTFDKKRSKNIALEILNRNIDIEWGCETHLNHLDEELLKIMYKAGLRSIEVGIESIFSSTLKALNRNSIEERHQRKIIELCDKLGIRTTAFYMIGLPDDNKAKIEETIKYAKELNTSTASFNIFVPYPGTKFFDKMKKSISENSFEKFGSSLPILQHKNLTESQLLKLKEQAYLEYYFRPRFIAKLIKSVLV